MTKYQESSISAAEYQRCMRIVIENEYQKAPLVNFYEETIITRADGTVIHQPVGGINMAVTDPTTAFDVYDPDTQEKTGATATLSQIYTLIWSVYMTEALKRDSQGV